MKILCTADVHIGNASTRLPADMDRASFTCASAWSRIVELAIDRNADLVLVGGDLIDRNNRFYEALRAVQSGLDRLSEKGIPVVAVAGNHDFDTLPALARDQGPHRLRLLGEGGRWESFDFDKNGERVRLVGWSFPRMHHSESPLRGAMLPPAVGLTIGLLHTDFRASQSGFAPTTEADFDEHSGVAAWLIGHVHKKNLWRLERTQVLNPGSPHPMDPGEPGGHGPWWMHAEGNELTIVQEPSCPIRYESPILDLGEVVSIDAFHEAVLDRLDGCLAEWAGSGLEVAIVRPELRLRTNLASDEISRACRALCGADDPDERLDATRSGVRILVDHATWTPLPPRIDLEARAKEADAVGKLAELILSLEAPPDERAPWVSQVLRDAQVESAATSRDNAYRKLRVDQGGEMVDVEESPEQIEAMVRSEAQRLLTELLRQEVPA